MEVIVTFQQMKRQLYWVFSKIKRPFCAPAPPNQAHGEPQTQHSTPWAAAGTSTHSELTENWHLRVYNELLGSIILDFQKLHPKEDTTRKYFVFFQAKLQTLGSWLCQTVALLGAKPAWSCQKIEYLKTHTGLNQTERQSCKRTSEKKMKTPLDPLDEHCSYGCTAWECLSN